MTGKNKKNNNNKVTRAAFGVSIIFMSWCRATVPCQCK